MIEPKFPFRQFFDFRFRLSKTVIFVTANPQAVRERLLVTATESGVDV
jgi:hypothetical protein